MTLFDSALTRTAPFHIYHGSAQIETHTGADIVTRARAISWQMQALGVGAGDIVVLMLPTSVELVACLLAAWGCRATVCIAPHNIGGEPGRLSHHRLLALLDLVQPKLIVHDTAHSHAFESSSAAQLHRAQLALAGNSTDFPAAPVPSDVAIVQLTSGSTSLPKGVPLTHGQVHTNVMAITDRLRVTTADHMVSWLPVCHDMGLGAFTVALGADTPLTLIPTERFVRAPTVWLEALSRQRATLSPSAAFSYALLTKFARRMKREAIDLSHWRYGWMGAEPISARRLDEFEQAMRPFGLRAHVVQPAYGLAEAVVAVSGNAPGEAVRRIHLDSVLLRCQGRVRLVDAQADNAITLVSNGKPIDGVAMSIRRGDGTPARHDEQGHVWISGPFVAHGYLGGVDAQRFQGGWFDTGDLGFVLDGEVYISGRAKDVIIRGGANTSPAHVEWVVERELELRPSQVAAFSYRHASHEQEEVVIVAGMQPAPAERSALIQRLSMAVAKEVGLTVDQVVFTAARHIPKTTSGKVQRGMVREMFLQGQFEHHDEITGIAITP